MSKHPVLYFIEDVAPTEEERKDAEKYGNVAFLNATYVMPDNKIRKNSGVAGKVPPLYAAEPKAKALSKSDREDDENDPNDRNNIGAGSRKSTPSGAVAALIALSPEEQQMIEDRRKQLAAIKEAGKDAGWGQGTGPGKPAGVAPAGSEGGPPVPTPNVGGAPANSTVPSTGRTVTGGAGSGPADAGKAPPSKPKS